MQSSFTRTAGSVSVERDAWHPRELLACKNEWPLVSFFAWHARIDKDVLQLASPTTACWPQPQARLPMSHTQVQPGAKMRRLRVVAASAI